jgi:arginase
MQLIVAPSNLGLSPLEPNHEPGTWRAPDALIRAGLLGRLNVASYRELPRPAYSIKAQPDTRLRNGHCIRSFNLELADLVREACLKGDFALVIGGDCSILLGALAGARVKGPVSLVHIDGHSDFRHPGNYDPEESLGAVAGMDLALATGRGEMLLTDWPGVPGPLVLDCHVVQLGEREGHASDFAWPDVNDTAINRIDIFEALAIGPGAVVNSIHETVNKMPEQGFWIHLDVDVLDQAIMPAVDSPGSPGLAPDDLVTILTPLIADSRCIGMTVTVFDPDLDPDEQYASVIVDILAQLPFLSKSGI